MSIQRPVVTAIPSAQGEVLWVPCRPPALCPGKVVVGTVFLWLPMRAGSALVPQVQSSPPHGTTFFSLHARVWSKWSRAAFLSLGHESTGSHGNIAPFGLAQQFWIMKQKKCTVLAWCPRIDIRAAKDESLSTEMPAPFLSLSCQQRAAW